MILSTQIVDTIGGMLLAVAAGSLLIALPLLIIKNLK